MANVSHNTGKEGHLAYVEDGVATTGGDDTAAVAKGTVSVLVPAYIVLVRCKVVVLVVSQELLLVCISDPCDLYVKCNGAAYEVFDASSTVIVSYTVAPVEVDIARVDDSVVVHSV